MVENFDLLEISWLLRLHGNDCKVFSLSWELLMSHNCIGGLVSGTINTEITHIIKDLSCPKEKSEEIKKLVDRVFPREYSSKKKNLLPKHGKKMIPVM